MLKKAKEDQQALEKQLGSIPVDRRELHSVIKDYLLSQGYAATLGSFGSAVREEEEEKGEC